jgi:catalase (peroxidase I)
MYWVHTSVVTTPFNGLAEPIMLLPTDAAFLTDIRFKHILQKYSDDQEAFDELFATSYGKLLALGTTTDEQGREECFDVLVVNLNV